MTASAEISGVGVSPGRAVGPVALMPDPVSEPPAHPQLPDGAARSAAAEAITEAAAQVRADLEARAERAHGDGKAVLEATALMAADPTLVSAAQAKTRDHGLPPARAVWEAAGDVAASLAALGGYFAERARDVADVRDRIIAYLAGRPAPGVPELPEPFVLVARDLAPADTATLDPATVLALVTAEGGPTSHTAILARTLGIPAVVAAAGVTDISAGTTVLVDGAAGRITIDPTPDQVAKARASGRRTPTFDGIGRTKDGHRVELLANVGDPKAARAAVEARAEGVGLFRTEFCFLDRAAEPSVAEQVTAYREVFGRFAGKKVVIRTLDAGADKPMPFLNSASEANPALGVRGARTAVRAPKVLANQLAAISQAAAAERAEVWVMAPMIATAEETAEFVARCNDYGLHPAGVMVEVPSAALCAQQVMQHADFVSIGTNDLTQYALAADRLLGELAELNDPWQPAVLRLVEMTGAAAKAAHRPVGVCGEAAADPALACVLVGLGVTSLSMSPAALAAVATVLAEVSYDECVRLGQLALAAGSAREGREAVRSQLSVLDDLGL